MRNKFTMPLVWHNCKICPPEELENPFLIITEGRNIYGASWNQAEGYYVAFEDDYMMLPLDTLYNWWWADIEQAVQKTKQFKGKMS